MIVAFFVAVVIAFAVPMAAQAHCPLCTAGAGILAVAAAALGVSPTAIGVFIGAFAVALGLWAHAMTRRFRFPGRGAALATLSFLLTVVPLAPLFDSYTSYYVSVAGDYGGFLNRTYVVNRFVLGALLGAALLALAPRISRAVSSVRKGVAFPYQGIVITFSILLLVSLAAQFAL